MSNECSCDSCGPGIEPGSTVLNVLHVVEYMSPDGEIWKIDLSCDNAGDDLAPGKYFELSQWANLMASAPILAEMVGSYLFGEDEDGTDDEISEVTV